MWLSSARAKAQTKYEIVSSESERLILVDSDDQEIGYLDKAGCHNTDGVLHRAFSLFIFNESGELLIQQRAKAKRLWPEYWSNSCCSHPREGEVMSDAIQRRMWQELNLALPMKYLYKFEYTARFKDIGSERELCWVYIGRTSDQPAVNTAEIADWRWISPAVLSDEIQHTPESFTPWFKQEWQLLNSAHASAIEDLKLKRVSSMISDPEY